MKDVSKKERLNQLVDAIPVCSEGKEAIRALTAELAGIELTAHVVNYRIGDRFHFKGGDYILTVHQTAMQAARGFPRVNAINLGNGCRVRGCSTRVKNMYAITNEELLTIFGTNVLASVVKFADSDLPISYTSGLGEQMP